MPLYLKANRKISVQDVKNAMRDHYEGTPLDISKDFGAGPYHTPYRLSPLSFKVNGQEYFNERPISTQQSGFVFVSQMRSTMPDAIGGVLWFGTDDANMTVFTPVYCCTDKVPVCYSRVDGADYITLSGEWMHPQFFLWKTVGLCIMATMEKSRMCLRHLHSPESIISACVYGMIRMTRTAMAMAAETMI